MRFWVKVFLSTMLVFVIAFAVGAIFLTEQAFEFNRQREIENGIREQSVILSSIENRIITIEQVHSDVSENHDRLTAIVRPLSDYYKTQNVLLALYNENTMIYSDVSDIDAGLLEFHNTQNKQNKNYTDMFINAKRYLLVASPLMNYPHLTFIYARDISQIDDFRKEISRSYQLISLIVVLLLGGIIYLMLRHMTRPIAKLNKITAQIAGGDYSKRVVINRSDEFGSLGHNFNVMADSVEENINRKQQFIDNLTHEMKTPLTAITGYAQYLRNVNCTQDERITAAGHLYDMAMRLENMSGKLLDLAFMRESNIALKPCNIENLFAALEKSTSHNLVIENSLTTINGDETLLLSMLTNLIENAARASIDNAPIIVRGYTSAGSVVEVIDTGHGMEQTEIKKITAPFYRVDTSRSRKFGGVGLGLSIVSQIVELHGAKLEIESETGKGTTVRIIFGHKNL
jgi:signal transduction histidine kinase